MTRADKQIAEACRLHEQALATRGKGNLGDALSLGQRALHLLEQSEGTDSPDVANVLNHLGATQADRGDYVEASKLHRRAVEIMEKCVGEANSLSSRRGRRGPGRGGLLRKTASPVRKRPSPHSSVARRGRSCGDPDLDRLLVQSLSGLGNLLRTQGRYAQAEPLLRRALKTAEAAFGSDDPEVAAALNNLGVLYKFSGRFAEAGRRYRRALRIVEKACGAAMHSLSPSEGERAGERRPSTDDVSFLATLYHNLGGLEHSRGRYARGEPFARRSVALRQKALGPDHPAVAEDVAALAALLDGQGKFDEAERLYRRALAVFERVHGLECYDVAVNLNNLAAIQQARGNFPESERLYRRALALKEKLLGRDHPDTGMTLHNLAVCYRANDRPAKARPLARRALKIFEKTLGRAHPHTEAARENWGALRAK